MCSLGRQNANTDENIVYNRHFGTSNDNINTPDINHSRCKDQHRSSWQTQYEQFNR